MPKRRLLSKPKEETAHATEKKHLAEYRETLQTETPGPKKATSSDQRIWRDVKTIEKNVDEIHVHNAEKPSSELDRVVDKLIAKRKK